MSWDPFFLLLNTLPTQAHFRVAKRVCLSWEQCLHGEKVLIWEGEDFAS